MLRRSPTAYKSETTTKPLILPDAGSEFRASSRKLFSNLLLAPHPHNLLASPYISLQPVLKPYFHALIRPFLDPRQLDSLPPDLQALPSYVLLSKVVSDFLEAGLYYHFATGTVRLHSKSKLRRYRGPFHWAIPPVAKTGCSLCHRSGHNKTTCKANPNRRHTHGPKRTKTQVKVSTSCSLCREPGHNRLTCPRNPKNLPYYDPLAAPALKDLKEITPLFAAPKPPSKPTRCSRCLQTGHNRLTCPKRPPAPPSPKRIFFCSLCHKKGHTKARCPRKPHS